MAVGGTRRSTGASDRIRWSVAGVSSRTICAAVAVDTISAAATSWLPHT